MVWVALVVLAAPAFDAALEERSGPVRLIAGGGVWAVWAAVLALLAIPSPPTLVAVRLLAPLAPVAALVAVVAGGPSAATAALAIGSTVLAAALCANGELGRHFVQASAYGDETRFPLRPPGALIAGPLPLFWLLTAAPCLAGPLLLAAGNWPAGVPLAALGVTAAVLLGRRSLPLARRWLVLVPAGVVVHDPLALAETVMFRSEEVVGCELAAATTEAADLTAGALGPALEFRLRDTSAKIVLNAPTREDPAATRAVHARAILVSPTRPGAALLAARDRLSAKR